MTLTFTPQELEALLAKRDLVHARRMLALLGEEPMENPAPDRMSDFLSRREQVDARIRDVEKDIPMPTWRELL